MALEDIVQGVNVKVTTEGADAAKDQIGGVEKAVESLAKTAKAASGGGSGGAGGAGVGDLSKALQDLSITGANAFSQIARGASSGDLTGLATLMGGPVAGSVAEASKALFSFMETQTAAGIKNAAMAKEFGTTAPVMQGMKSSFEEAGVSGAGFERLVNRMSRQVATDYPDMMRNVSESNLRSQKSALGLEEAQHAVQKSFEGNGPEQATQRLQEAQEKLQESYGVPKEAFAAQDKLRDRRKDQLAVDDAINAQDEAFHSEQTKRKQTQIALQEEYNKTHEQELKDIPHITQELENSAKAGSQSSDVQDASVKTLRESIEHMAQTGSGPASPLEVLKKQMDLIGSGAIDTQKALELMQSQMGGRAASGAGLGGLDAAQLVSIAQKSGSAPIAEAEGGKDTINKLGLGQTPADTTAFKAFAASVSEAAGIWSALMQKLGAVLATNIGTPIVKKIAEAGEGISDIVSGIRGGKDENGKEIDRGAMLRSGAEKLLYTGSGGGGGGTDAGVTRPHFAIDDAEKKREQLAGEDNITDPNHPELGNSKLRGPTPGGPVNPDYVAPSVNAPATAADPAAPIKAASSEVGGVLQELAQIIRSAATGIATNKPATVPGAAWRGGLIRGFASGGRVRIPGFADGGTWQDTLRDQAIGLGVGRWGEAAANAGLEAAELGARSVVGVTGSVLSNPLGIGLLDASPVAAADAHGGASAEEAAARAIGGRNALEADRLRSGADIRMWGGGIPGFAAGGGVQMAELALNIAKNDLHNAKSPDQARVLSQRVAMAELKLQQAKDQETSQNLEKLHGLGGAAPLLWSGGIPGFATGSVSGPGNGTSDSILARLSNGEFVMKEAAVRTYGAGFMHAINDMRIPPPKFDMGGMVPGSSLQRFAEGGGIGAGGSPVHLHIGGETFEMAAGGAVAERLKKFAIGQQAGSTGRKPSWVT
jgi:hypothetical protein